MVAYLNRMAGMEVEQPQVKVEQPRTSQRPPVRRVVISIGRLIWHWLVIAFSGPGLDEEQGGIDDTALPSGFMVPYKRGSRQVRNLWHEPF